MSVIPITNSNQCGKNLIHKHFSDWKRLPITIHMQRNLFNIFAASFYYS